MRTSEHRKTPIEFVWLYRRLPVLSVYVRLPNLIRRISFIYIPLNFGGFPYSVLKAAIPIQFNGILYCSIVYSVVIVATRRSLFVLVRMIDIPALSEVILAQAIQVDIREYQSRFWVLVSFSALTVCIFLLTYNCCCFVREYGQDCVAVLFRIGRIFRLERLAIVGCNLRAVLP